MNTDNFKRTAYHESGHIVIAYLVGYTCDYAKLLIDTEGDGQTSINYGEDLLLIAGITNCMDEPDIFNELPNPVKKQSPGIARRIATILVAGSAAEAVFLNEVVREEVALELSGEDLRRIVNVEYLLKQIIKEHPDDYTHQRLTEVVTWMREIEEINEAVNKMALQLLERTELSKAEIEKTLNDTGFIAYRDSL
jgi:hypothetical protein